MSPKPLRDALCLLALAGATSVSSGQSPANKPILVLNTGGHTAPVAQALFTPDGNELITVSLDKTIRFWDSHTGRSLRVLRTPVGPGHQGELLAAALSPDGETLAVAGFGFVQDKKLLVAPIYLIDRKEGKIGKVLPGHSGPVFTLSFSRDGKTLASGGADHLIRVWDVPSGKRLHLLKGHVAPVTSLALAPDGKALVSCGTPPHVGSTMDRTRVAWLWDVQKEQVTAHLEGHHRKEVRQVAWSPNGQRILTGSHMNESDNFIAVWDDRGKHLRNIPLPENRLNGCVSLAFAPDGKTVLLGLKDKFYIHNVEMDFASGKVLHVYAKGNYLYDEIPQGRVTPSPDGKLVAVASDHNYRTVVFERTTGKRICTLGGLGQQPTIVSWVKGPGRTIAWRATLAGQNYEPKDPLPAGDFFQRAFALDELRPVAVPAGKGEVFQRSHYRQGPFSLDFTGTTANLLRGNKPTGIQLLPPDKSGHNILASSFLSPDRAVLTTATGMHLFDVSEKGKGKGEPLWTYRGYNGMVQTVAPSPDKARYLLASGEDKVIRIWEAGRADPLLSLFFVPPPPLKNGKPAGGGDWIAWTPEGYYAASPGGERLMGWQVDNGPNKLGTFLPAERFRKALFRPDVIRLLLEKGQTGLALEAANKALQAEGIKVHKAVGEVDDLLPPKVKLIIIDKSKLPTVTLKVEAEASAKDQPLESLRLMVDGRPFTDKQAARTYDPGWRRMSRPGR
jgi:WD40 repeat protein